MRLGVAFLLSLKTSGRGGMEAAGIFGGTPFVLLAQARSAGHCRRAQRGVDHIARL
jgi:hypothetical protein